MISPEELREMALRAHLPAYALSRMYARHGGALRDILFLIEENPHWKRVICASEPVLEAEVRYCIDEEWATSLDDLGRRTRLGWGGCQGTECVWPAAQILKEKKGKDPKEEVQTFLQKRWKSLMPYLQGESIAQEELKHTVWGNSFEV